jgi:hypothetical protein
MPDLQKERGFRKDFAKGRTKEKWAPHRWLSPLGK